ncbi:MAG: trigger factor family protein, partial [Sphaerochaetaceae bacterium]|nr:trigger factor family protein [Sphaerochaetaceae bacterium]
MEKYTKKFEKLEKSAVKMTLTFTAAAVDADYQAQLAKYAKQLTINGFRKGKAPVSVIENKYGETVLNETFTDMLDKAVQEVFNPEDEKNAVAKEFQPIDSRALDLVNE